jgi:hypothetical protein
MLLLRGHEMEGDSAEVGYQGIADGRWMGVWSVSDAKGVCAGGQSGCLLLLQG